MTQKIAVYTDLDGYARDNVVIANIDMNPQLYDDVMEVSLKEELWMFFSHK